MMLRMGINLKICLTVQTFVVFYGIQNAGRSPPSSCEREMHGTSDASHHLRGHPGKVPEGMASDRMATWDAGAQSEQDPPATVHYAGLLLQSQILIPRSRIQAQGSRTPGHVITITCPVAPVGSYQ